MICQLQKQCKKWWLLPREKYRYVKAWFYFTKPGHYLLTQICWCKILSVHGRRSGPFAKNLRCFWWSIYCFLYRLRSCWWKFYSEVFKHMQIYCWGIDPSQLYSYSVCQSMPIGRYTLWNFNSDTSRFTPRQNKTRSFENMVNSYFQRTGPECEIENIFKTGRQKKTECFSVDGFFFHWNTVFEVTGCFYHFCTCQELRPYFTEEDIRSGSKKGEFDVLRQQYIQEKGFKVIEMWEYYWWILYKTTNTVKQHIREHFPYKRSLAAEQRLEEIKEGKFIGYVQCEIEVPEKLRSKIENFPPIFNYTSVSNSEIGDLMKNYAEAETLLSQPWQRLLSSFTLQNGTLILQNYNTLLCCSFIYNWVLFEQEYTVLLSTLQRKPWTVLCSKQWTQEGKVTKIQTQVSSQKQWSF